MGRATPTQPNRPSTQRRSSVCFITDVPSLQEAVADNPELILDRIRQMKEEIAGLRKSEQENFQSYQLMERRYEVSSRSHSAFFNPTIEFRFADIHSRRFARFITASKRFSGSTSAAFNANTASRPSTSAPLAMLKAKLHSRKESTSLQLGERRKRASETHEHLVIHQLPVMQSLTSSTRALYVITFILALRFLHGNRHMLGVDTNGGVLAAIFCSV
jgi:hypothetical protein